MMLIDTNVISELMKLKLDARVPVLVPRHDRPALNRALRPLFLRFLLLVAEGALSRRIEE
jgi:hypothetical protein